MKDEININEEVERLIVPTNEILFGVLTDGTVVNNVGKFKHNGKPNPMAGYDFYFKSMTEWIKTIPDDELLCFMLTRFVNSEREDSIIKSRLGNSHEF